MNFDIEKLKEKAEKDYEEAWKDSGDLIDKKGRSLSLEDKGSSHPLFNLVQEFRGVFTDLGFREIIVPALIDESEIHKQYGPQAPIILDRIFFLAGLDRSDLGIAHDDLEKIREEIPEFDRVDELEDILREYKEGGIDSDDFTEVLMERLGLDEDESTHILSLFDDFMELEPVPSKKTLRSHTTAGWFPVLQEMQFREPLPIQLFTVGPKYRREQMLDETHLYRSWTGSLVVMAEEMTLEDGKELSRRVLEKLGFDKVEFKVKLATSKYYAPDSEFEIFVEHPETGEMIEVGNGGFYSPVPLANYDIRYPVFNLGIGLERILMIRTGEEDIRELVYPYEYKDLDLSDGDISEMLDYGKMPLTGAGEELARMIEEVARDRKDEPSPCEFKVYEGKIQDLDVKVKLVESEEGTQLVGPAAFNQIYVYEGNVVGLPSEGWEDDEFLEKVRREGVPTQITYLRAFANRAAREVEEAVEEGKEKLEVRVPIVESLSDINLKLEKPARRYITDNKKKIDVRGPMFTTAEATIG